MTNANTSRLQRIAALGVAAAAAVALASFANDAEAAPGHGFRNDVRQCRERLANERANYRTEDARLQRLTELRIFRGDRHATRRVHRIAATARERAQAILSQGSWHARGRAANRCTFRLRKWQMASRELRLAMDDINHIRARQFERQRRDRRARRSPSRDSRPVWNYAPVQTRPISAPVTRDHRGHDHSAGVSCGTTPTYY